MKYQAENAVSSFFYYMWNAWCEEECRTVFKEMHPHFWEKWSLMTDKGIFGAAERFYAELTDRYREKLVERAVSLYDGKARRKHPDDSEIKVKEKDSGPSCSLAEALEKQDLFINSTLAQLGCNILWKMFRNGMIEHQGLYLNLSTLKMNPIPV